MLAQQSFSETAWDSLSRASGQWFAQRTWNAQLFRHDLLYRYEDAVCRNAPYDTAGRALDRCCNLCHTSHHTSNDIEPGVSCLVIMLVLAVSVITGAISLSRGELYMPSNLYFMCHSDK